MFKARMLFEKTESGAYISHLDLMKTIQRSFKRAGFKLRYSQGFNPHMYLSILAPLSTGFESKYELCDFDLLTDECPSLDILNSAFPSGIRAIKVIERSRQVSEIAFSQYTIVYDADIAEEASEIFKNDIIFDKRSKRGSREVSLKDYMSSISFDSKGGETVCRCILRAGEDPLNPSYISEILIKNRVITDEIFVSYTREKLLDANYTDFI